PGAGSARFLVQAGRRFPTAELWGIELDPVAALLARAHLTVAGLASRARIVVADYRDAALPPRGRRTRSPGHPPSVPHHPIVPPPPAPPPGGGGGPPGRRPASSSPRAGWPASTPTSCWPPRRGHAPATTARSSPPPSGWT